jgi:hypothetical protein
MSFWQEHKDRLKNFLDKMTNDSHVPVAIFVFCVTFAYVVKGHDLPPGFVSSLYAFYGFLGGHALVYQKWPDPTNPTTVVNVDNTNSNASSSSASADAADAPNAPAPGNGTAGPKG